MENESLILCVILKTTFRVLTATISFFKYGPISFSTNFELELMRIIIYKMNKK